MSKFVMNQDDWNTIQQYSRYAYDEHGSEIGGYMLVKEVDNKFVFTDPVILEQEICASNTEITSPTLIFSEKLIQSFQSKTTPKCGIGTFLPSTGFV